MDLIGEDCQDIIDDYIRDLNNFQYHKNMFSFSLKDIQFIGNTEKNSIYIYNQAAFRRIFVYNIDYPYTVFEKFMFLLKEYTIIIEDEYLMDF